MQRLQTNHPSTEQVNAQDEEDHASNLQSQSSPHAIPPPSSPPPSFHSRASSIAPGGRNRRVNDPALADAFDADDSDNDDNEPDDRQRLVRQNTDPVPSASSAQDMPASTPSLEPARPSGATAGSGATNRVYGGGIENGGVFSNLTAKPERKTGPEKEEMPPVCLQCLHLHRQLRTRRSMLESQLTKHSS